MMSTPSWISRVLCESCSVHLEDDHEPTDPVDPFPCAAAPLHDSQLSQTVKYASSDAAQTRRSPAAAMLPPPSATVAAAPPRTASAPSPRNATVTSIDASTTDNVASFAAAPSTGAAHALAAAFTSVTVAVPPLPPLVDNFVGTLSKTPSPGSGLSPVTDTSTTNSSKQQEVAAPMVPSATRPAAVIASAPASPLLPDSNVAFTRHEWSGNPVNLSPSALTREQGESEKNTITYCLAQRMTTAQKAPIERLTTASSTPGLATVAAAPLATLSRPTSPGKAPGESAEHAAEALRTTPGVISPASPLVGPANVAGASQVDSLAGSVRASTRAADRDALTSASSAQPELTKRPAVQQEAEKKTKKSENARSPSSQKSLPICQLDPIACLSKTCHSPGACEASSSCIGTGHPLQKHDNLERPPSGSSTTNSGLPVSNLHASATNPADKQAAKQLEAAVSANSLGQVAAFCTADANIPAATANALKSIYPDTSFTPLQPVNSSASSSAGVSQQLFSPYTCFTASSPYYPAGDVETSPQRTVSAIGEASCGSVKYIRNCTTSSELLTTCTNNSTSSKGASDRDSTAPDSGVTSFNDGNTSNDDGESSNTSFLPSLLPLLCHIRTLSISATDSPHTVPTGAGATSTQHSSHIHTSTSGGGAAFTSSFSSDSLTNRGQQNQPGCSGVSPKRASPYFPFFSFNSISSAFQSPAVSHLSRKGFCDGKAALSPTVPAFPSAKQQPTATFSAFSSPAALSLAPQHGTLVPKESSETRGPSGAASRGGTQEGLAMTRAVALENGSKEGTAAASGYSGVTSIQAETKALPTLATNFRRDQRPIGATRSKPAGENGEDAPHAKGLEPSAADGHGTAVAVAGAGVAAAPFSSPLLSLSAAKTVDLSPELTGPFATDQHQLIEYTDTGKHCSSNSSAVSSSISSSIGSSPCDLKSSENTLGCYVALPARGSTEHQHVALQPSTLQPLDWSSCFPPRTPRPQEETATAILAGGLTFAVDKVYCMQTPSRTRFSSVRVSPSLSQIYAASDNGVLCVWNMTGCCQRPLVISSYHSKAITELDVSPDGQLLASASLDGTIRLKYTATATHVVHPSCTSAVETHVHHKSYALASSRAVPAGHTHSPAVVASASQTAAAHSVNAGTAHLFAPYQPAAPSSTPTVSAAQIGAGLQGKKPPATLSHPSVPPSPPFCRTQPSSFDTSQARSLPTISRLQSAASTARQKDLPSPPPTHLRRPTSGEQQLQQHTIRGHSNAVVSLHFSSNGALLLSASRDKSLKLWRTPSLEFLAAFTGHTNWVCCARFAPISGSAPVTFASCAEDRTVRIWNVERKAPLLSFRLCETFQSTSGAPLCGSLGTNNLSNSTCGNRGWGTLTATGATSSSSKFGPCLKSCRFIFGGASVLAGGSSDGTVTLWDVRQEPKAPSQYYNSSWLQSAPLFSTASRPRTSGGDPSSFAGDLKLGGASLVCDIDRKESVKKAGISYLDTTSDGTSLLALSTSGVAHLIDLRYNKPLFSVSHTKTCVIPHGTPLVARGKKSKATHLHRQHSISWSTPLPGTLSGSATAGSVAAQDAAASMAQNAVGHATAIGSAAPCALSHAAADVESATFCRQQQQQRQKRTTAVITAASFGPVVKKYETLSELQQLQVLATADAEGRVVIWRWDTASPQVLYQQEHKAAAAAVEFRTHEQALDPFAAVCSPYSADSVALYLPHKTASDSTQPYVFAEEETHATEADYLGGASCRQTAENYSLLEFEGDVI